MGTAPAVGVNERRWFILEDNPMTGLNDVRDIPKRWLDGLALVRQLIPTAVMAGGCLRDRTVGVPVKDIDIFVPVDEDRETDLNKIVAMLATVGVEGTIVGDKMYPRSDNRIIGVVDFEIPGAPPFQIVVGQWGKTIDDLFSCFDFGICQIATNGKEIWRGRHFILDHRNKRFRLCTQRSREAFQQSIERFARLKAEKFKDWTFDLGNFHPQFYADGGMVWSAGNPFP